MSTTKPTLDIAHVRQTAYVHGRALVDTVTTRRGVGVHHVKLAAERYREDYPATEHGLTFDTEEIGHLPGTWGIYASAVPLLEPREVWDLGHVGALLKRLEAWGSPVLVRQFATSGTTRVTVHRDNTKTREAYTALAPVKFRSQTMGHTRRVYGEFAYLGDTDE
ncbi:hypothetical protein [Nocardia phage NS-I]|jgi:hypothetical protein|nr:hypothetical protein [Nocardia phage NS-I]